MVNIKELMPLVQIAIALIIIVLILFQQRGTGLGSAFGQDSGFYATRRGVQKKILWLTVFLSLLFVAVSLLNLAV